MKELIIIEDREIIEKQISRNLEKSLYKKDLITAKINLDFYTEHIKHYGSLNLQYYYNLRNRYNNLVWGGK